MSYIGNTPAESFISFEKQVFTIVNSQTAYTLSHSVVNENDIRLVVNNVVQEPGSGKAYTASGTTLTLSAALVNGTDEMYCVFLGRALQTVNAPNASVGIAQLADSAKNTPMVAGYLSSNQTVTSNTSTKLQYNTEFYDTDSAYDNSTNYRFTVPSGKAGKYLVSATAYGFGSNNDERQFAIDIYKNGSQLRRHFESVGTYSTSLPSARNVSITAILDLSASDYIEFFGLIRVDSGTPSFYGSTGTDKRTFFSITRMVG